MNWLRANVSEKHARRTAAVLTLMYGTGLRVNEACQVRQCDLSSDSSVLPELRIERRTTKGKHQGRVVPLHPFIQNEMQAWRNYLYYCQGDDGPWLFPILTGRGKAFSQERHVHPHEVKGMLRTARNALGLGPRVATHSMRKSCANLLYTASGKDILVVKEILGHKDIATTMRYLSLQKDAVENAVSKMFSR